MKYNTKVFSLIALLSFQFYISRVTALLEEPLGPIDEEGEQANYHGFSYFKEAKSE